MRKRWLGVWKDVALFDAREFWCHVFVCRSLGSGEKRDFACVTSSLSTDLAQAERRAPRERAVGRLEARRAHVVGGYILMVEQGRRLLCAMSYLGTSRHVAPT